MMRALFSLCLVAASAFAQTTVLVPPGSLGNVNLPWAAGIGRYQQWYSAPSMQGDILEPMRITRAEFFAGSISTSNATTISCEVLMGHGFGQGLTATFDNNYATAPVVVAPLQTINLAAGAQGSTVINIPFTTLFTWDRVRPLVLEIRVHGNGFSNQSFLYNFNGVLTATAATQRVYQSGSVGAATGLWQQGVGLKTRFHARPGVMLDFGTGCAGGGGITPKNRTLQIMEPGIAWTHELQNAAVQQFAIWIMGTTNTSPFPADISVLLGYPASGCMLRTDPAWLGAYVTVGGSPGTGFATFTWQLPPVTGYIGVSFFTQWLVFDPFSPNGVLTMTQGIHHICAPVGG